MTRHPGRMRIAVLIAIVIHAAVLFLVHPTARRQLDAEPGDRIDVTLAPGTSAPKSAPDKAVHAPRRIEPKAQVSHQASPTLPTAQTDVAPNNTGISSRAEQTPVITAHTNEPPAPSTAAASQPGQAGAGGGPPAAGSTSSTASTPQESAGGSDQPGADDAAAILSYVAKLAREIRRATRDGHPGSALSRQVRVQIALDHGAPSVRVLGSSDVREFDQISVAAANRALVAVKPPLELFDKRFRFSVCMQFNSADEGYALQDNDVRAGKRGADGVLDLYFEHGVRCDTAVSLDETDGNEARDAPRLDPGLARYRDALLAEVKKRWFYPGAAHRRDQGDLEGTVAVEISSEGGAPLARASYSATNRYPPLNDAAEIIARNAIAAIALPAELQGKPFRFEVPIEFKPDSY